MDRLARGWAALCAWEYAAPLVAFLATASVEMLVHGLLALVLGAFAAPATWVLCGAALVVYLTAGCPWPARHGGWGDRRILNGRAEVVAYAAVFALGPLMLPFVVALGVAAMPPPRRGAPPALPLAQ